MAKTPTSDLALFKRIAPEDNAAPFNLTNTISEVAGDKVDRPHVVSIVMNQVIGDSRVIKTAQAAIRKGYTASIVGFANAPEPAATMIGDIQVFLVPNPRFAMVQRKVWAKDREKRDMGLYVRTASAAMVPVVKQLRPTLLHTHDMYALEVGFNITNELTKNGAVVPWIHDLHEYVIGLTNISPNYLNVALRFQRQYLKQPNALITVSDLLAEYLRKDYSLNKLPTVIFNTPFQSHFDPHFRDVRSELGLEKSDPLCVYVGGLGTVERGAAVIVESMVHLPRLHVCFVTSHNNDVTAALKASAKLLGVSDRLHFLPFVPSDKVSSFVRTADVGIHPMVHYPNGEVAMPNKLFEYLHGGVPVVVSDVIEMKRFVDSHGVGTVFAADDAVSCADAIRRILDNPKLFRDKITPELLAEFSWESQENKLAELYSGLMAEYRPHDTAATFANSVDNFRVVHCADPTHSAASVLSDQMTSAGTQSSVIRVGVNFNQTFGASERVFSLPLFAHLQTVMPQIAPLYDVFHFHYRVLGDQTGGRWPDSADLVTLRAAGKRLVVTLALGDAVTALEDDEQQLPAAVRKAVENLLERFRAVSHAIVAADPAAQYVIPELEYVPQAIDLETWKPLTTDNPVPVLLYPYVDDDDNAKTVRAAASTLKAGGLEFQLRALTQSDDSALHAALQEADIVIGRLDRAWCDEVSLKAMAMGKTVVCSVAEPLLHNFSPGRLAVACAKPEDLVRVLNELIVDAETRASLCAAARRYCERVHDGKKIAGRYLEIYRDIIVRPGPVDFWAFREYLEAPVKRAQSAAAAASAKAAAPAKKAAPRATTKPDAAQAAPATRVASAGIVSRIASIFGRS